MKIDFTLCGLFLILNGVLAKDDPLLLSRIDFNFTIPRYFTTPRPFIKTTTSSRAPLVTCICVPTGQCNSVEKLPTANIASSIAAALGPITATATQTTTCGKNLQLCCNAGSYQCGVRFPPVAGAPLPLSIGAPYGAYPWQAVLLGPGDLFAGSGALIDNFHILTVAHKVTPFLNGTLLKVRLGEWDATSTSEPIPIQQYVVARIFVHPSFVSTNLRNDIAILRLSSPVPLGTVPTIATACLPQLPFLNTRCWVSGWGKDDFSSTGKYQRIQRQVDLPIIDHKTCQNLLRSTRLGDRFQLDPVSFMCAGGEPGKDACTGDGGSPLVCERNNHWFVAGLVSWGIGCGESTVPGVYTNVFSYISWIQATVNS